MYSITRAALVVLLIGLVAMTACNGDENDTNDTDTQTAADTQDQAQPATSVTTTPAPDQAPQKLAGAHILIMYQGSQRAPETITRTKEEALALAQEVARKAKDGGDFAALAQEYSDGPSGSKGGDLGIWVQGRMVPEFDTAILGMEVGGVSDPVETAFGYHVITRKKVD